MCAFEWTGKGIRLGRLVKYLRIFSYLLDCKMSSRAPSSTAPLDFQKFKTLKALPARLLLSTPTRLPLAKRIALLHNDSKSSLLPTVTSVFPVDKATRILFDAVTMSAVFTRFWIHNCPCKGQLPLNSSLNLIIVFSFLGHCDSKSKIS